MCRSIAALVFSAARVREAKKSAVIFVSECIGECVFFASLRFYRFFDRPREALLISGRCLVVMLDL